MILGFVRDVRYRNGVPAELVRQDATRNTDLGAMLATAALVRKIGAKDEVAE
ncbi:MULTISPECIES: hypothetical protein [unclassified Mesorhizobium]|uniref:hypothetical protein n=1 Tax=unclassified Mesorhizobium TaxID=325217 RepID=UPI0024180D3D|nr:MULTISPECIES: hypothetical protein [unclassified Mesorhizobium]MDG4896380.1 hypothetical protein [Mesorhizobium sp. WSM4976]